MISILISTIDDRIKRAKNVLLSPRNDVEYVISHQYTEDQYRYVPSELKRDDVFVTQIPGKGVSESRNHAIQLARGDIALLADDDVTYRHQYIDTVKETYEYNPDIDVALFKIKTGPGEPPYKNYPEKAVEFRKKMFAISTIEISFNLKRIKEAEIYFDERFGLGHDLLIGSEETIFVEDCLKKDLNVFYIPEFIVEHSYKSTIDSVPKYDKRKNWVTGAYDCRSNGKIALLKAFLGTLKMIPDLLKQKINPLTYLYQRLSAVIYILRTSKKESVYDQSLTSRSEEDKSKRKEKTKAPLIM